MEIYDVIIVGGGYSGLSCACQLADRKVLILEAQKVIPKKHRGCQCTLLNFGEEYRSEGKDILFSKLGIRVPDGIKSFINRLEFRSSNHFFSYSLRNPVTLIDEGAIKDALLGECQRKGIEVKAGVSMQSFRTDGEMVTIVADQEYQAKVLVGADGAHSRIMKELNIRRKELGVLFELEYELESLDIPEKTMLFEMSEIKSGLYAQPYGDNYLMGVFQVVGKNDLRRNLQEEMEKKIVKLKGKGVVHKYGATLPIYTSAPCSYYQNIILTGDAIASFSLSMISGAIMMGILAGRAVSKYQVNNSKAFKEYDKEWRKVLVQSSFDGMRYLSPLVKRLNERRMDKLTSVFQGRDLAEGKMGFYIKNLPRIISSFLF